MNKKKTFRTLTSWYNPQFIILNKVKDKYIICCDKEVGDDYLVICRLLNPDVKFYDVRTGWAKVHPKEENKSLFYGKYLAFARALVSLNNVDRDDLEIPIELLHPDYNKEIENIVNSLSNKPNYL